MISKDDKNITETRPPLQYTIPSGIQTPLTVKTLPDGVCTLPLASGEDFKVYADKDGIISLHVSFPKESEILKKVIIDCKTGDNVTRFPIDLRVSSTPTRDMPSQPSDLPRPSTRTTVLPALSEKDIMDIPNSDLRKRGLPVRPDAKKDSEAFNRWKEIALGRGPVTVVEPQVVEIPHRRQSPQIVPDPLDGINWFTNIWSGLRVGGNQISEASGTFYLPTVISRTGRLEGAAFWVGIDGPGGSGVLPQTGVNVVVGLGTDGVNYNKYTLFYEVADPANPNASSSLYNNVSPPLGPGDRVSVNIELESFFLGFGYPGLYASFYAGRVTAANNPSGAEPIPPGVPSDLYNAVPPIGNVTGEAAYWIVEKQLILGAGGSTGLANYGSLEMMYETYSYIPHAANEGALAYFYPSPQNSSLGAMTSDGTANGIVLSTVTGQTYGDPNNRFLNAAKTDFSWRSAS